MNEELPTEAAPAEQQAEEVTQNTDTGSELAPDSGENHEEKQSEGEIAQAAINKQHKRFRDEERGHQDTKAQLQKAQQELDALQANQPKPVIPDALDRMDFDTDAEYSQHLALRDAAIRADANFQQNQGYIAQVQQNDANSRAIAEQNRQAEDAQKLTDNATKLGIKIDDLVTASQIIGGYNLDPSIVSHLMTHEDGPVMMAHLAANAAELLDPLRTLPLGQAFNLLQTRILEGAQALKPKTSNAPDPPVVLSGSGAPEGKDKLPNDMGYSLE